MELMLVYGFVVVMILFLLYFYQCRRQRKTATILLGHWWGDTEKEEDDGYIKYFTDLFDCILYDYDIIVIHSLWADSYCPEFDETKDKVLHVQFSGESIFEDPSKYDLTLGPVETDYENKTITHTLASPWIQVYGLEDKLFTNQRNYETDKASRDNQEFCVFVVSNPNCEIRNKFYEALSDYKHVDSCGGYKNSGCALPKRDTEEYYDVLSQYRFMICFENRRYPYYLTEKLINAYCGKTIPIYFGCDVYTKKFINPEAVVWVEDESEESIIKAIDRVIELEENPDKYKYAYEQPLFLSTDFLYKDVKKEIKKFFNK